MMMITPAHRELIRALLRGKSGQPHATAEQRSTIRRICGELTPVSEPEKVLIAFKTALEDAADAERIRYGVERTTLLSEIVTMFIAEFYAAGDHGKVTHSSNRNGAALVQQITKGGSPAARL